MTASFILGDADMAPSPLSVHYVVRRLDRDIMGGTVYISTENPRWTQSEHHTTLYNNPKQQQYKQHLKQHSSNSTQVREPIDNSFAIHDT